MTVPAIYTRSYQDINVPTVEVGGTFPYSIDISQFVIQSEDDIVFHEVLEDGTLSEPTYKDKITVDLSRAAETGTSSTLRFPKVTLPVEAAGKVVRASRVTPITQETDFTPAGDFRATDQNDALDKLTLISQEISDKADRAIRVNRSDTLADDLPTPSGDGEHFVRVDNSGGTLTPKLTPRGDLITAREQGAGYIRLYIALKHDARTIAEAIDFLVPNRLPQSVTVNNEWVVSSPDIYTKANPFPGTIPDPQNADQFNAINDDSLWGWYARDQIPKEIIERPQYFDLYEISFFHNPQNLDLSKTPPSVTYGSRPDEKSVKFTTPVKADAESVVEILLANVRDQFPVDIEEVIEPKATSVGTATKNGNNWTIELPNANSEVVLALFDQRAYSKGILVGKRFFTFFYGVIHITDIQSGAKNRWLRLTMQFKHIFARGTTYSDIGLTTDAETTDRVLLSERVCFFPTLENILPQTVHLSDFNSEVTPNIGGPVKFEGDRYGNLTADDFAPNNDFEYQGLLHIRAVKQDTEDENPATAVGNVIVNFANAKVLYRQGRDEFYEVVDGKGDKTLFVVRGFAGANPTPSPTVDIDIDKPGYATVTRQDDFTYFLYQAVVANDASGTVTFRDPFRLPAGVKGDPGDPGDDGTDGTNLAVWYSKIDISNTSANYEGQDPVGNRSGSSITYPIRINGTTLVNKEFTPTNPGNLGKNDRLLIGIVALPAGGLPVLQAVFFAPKDGADGTDGVTRRTFYAYNLIENTKIDSMRFGEPYLRSENYIPEAFTPSTHTDYVIGTIPLPTATHSVVQFSREVASNSPLWNSDTRESFSHAVVVGRIGPKGIKGDAGTITAEEFERQLRAFLVTHQFQESNIEDLPENIANKLGFDENVASVEDTLPVLSAHKTIKETRAMTSEGGVANRGKILVVGDDGSVPGGGGGGGGGTERVVLFSQPGTSGDTQELSLAQRSTVSVTLSEDIYTGSRQEVLFTNLYIIVNEGSNSSSTTYRGYVIPREAFFRPIFGQNYRSSSGLSGASYSTSITLNATMRNVLDIWQSKDYLGLRLIAMDKIVSGTAPVRFSYSPKSGLWNQYIRRSDAASAVFQASRLRALFSSATVSLRALVQQLIINASGFADITFAGVSAKPTGKTGIKFYAWHIPGPRGTIPTYASDSALQAAFLQWGVVSIPNADGDETPTVVTSNNQVGSNNTQVSTSDRILIVGVPEDDDDLTRSDVIDPDEHPLYQLLLEYRLDTHVNQVQGWGTASNVTRDWVLPQADGRPTSVAVIDIGINNFRGGENHFYLRIHKSNAPKQILIDDVVGETVQGKVLYDADSSVPHFFTETTVTNNQVEQIQLVSPELSEDNGVIGFVGKTLTFVYN